MTFFNNNSTFNLPMLSSIVLHILVIAFLSYNAWQYNDSDAGVIDGETINAIMVDTSIMTQEYQRQLDNNIAQQRAEKEKQKQLKLDKQKQQALSAAKKQAEIDAEKAKLQAQKRKEQAELALQKAKADAELNAKKAAEAAKQKEIAAAEKQASADSQKAVETRDHIKELAERIDKQAEKQKKTDDKALDDIIGGLTAKKPPAPKGKLDNEQAKYMSLVKTAISNRFSNPKLYSGRTCTLKILIASDGLLLDVVSNSGDPYLCRDAIAATRQATIPQPPESLYQRVKEMVIDFQPK